ncbi:hypothetical protein EDB85DRAFT_1887165 [Lactarius pseudohatsudake]|nr:hypothetical protein EDB85DRAFT_1887165 [Lactarius pseudohatsudake]
MAFRNRSLASNSARSIAIPSGVITMCGDWTDPDWMYYSGHGAVLLRPRGCRWCRWATTLCRYGAWVSMGHGAAWVSKGHDTTWVSKGHGTVSLRHDTAWVSMGHGAAWVSKGHDAMWVSKGRDTA